MTALTANEIRAKSMTAAEYIAEENAATPARALAGGWLGWGTMAPEAYTHCVTGYDVMLENARQEYSDTYKEMHGFRPTPLVGYTVAEIMQEVSHLYKSFAVTESEYLDDFDKDSGGNRVWTF